MILNETRFWTARFRPVLAVVYCFLRQNEDTRVAFKFRHITTPSHICHCQTSQDHTSILAPNATWKPGRAKKLPVISKAEPPGTSLLDSTICPCQCTYHVFQLTVNSGDYPDEWLYIPYGHPHLWPMIDLIDYHSRYCHCCHIWLWWAWHSCMFFSNWNVNSTTLLAVLVFPAEVYYYLILFSAPHSLADNAYR